MIWTTALQGLGVGLIWVPLSVITLSTLPSHLRPEATAIFHLLRNIGSSIFISLSITMVIRTSRISYAGLAEFVSPYNENLALPWVSGGWGVGSQSELLALGAEITRQANMIGYLNAFAMFSLVALLAVPLVFLVRWQR